MRRLFRRCPQASMWSKFGRATSAVAVLGHRRSSSISWVTFRLSTPCHHSTCHHSTCHHSTECGSRWYTGVIEGRLSQGRLWSVPRRSIGGDFRPSRSRSEGSLPETRFHHQTAQCLCGLNGAVLASRGLFPRLPGLDCSPRYTRPLHDARVR